MLDNAGRSINDVMNVRKASPTATNGVKYDVKYRKPVCGESATDDVSFDCETPAKALEEFGYNEFYFDDYVAEEFSLSADDYDLNCEDPSQALARILATKAESMITKFNRKVAAKLVARAGSTFAGTDATSVTPAKLKLFKPLADGSSVPQPTGLYDLSYDYMRMNPMGGQQPVLIGSTKAIGAFSATSGLYDGNVDGLDVNDFRNNLSGAYMDYSLPTTLAGSPALNPIISFLPGAVELVEFYRFDNPSHRIVDGGRVVWLPEPIRGSGTMLRQKVDIGTPVIGRPFIVDMQVRYDECTNTISYKMRKEFDIWTIPQDAFCEGTTWNYIQLWDAVCEAYNCIDVVGEPAPEPAA